MADKYKGGAYNPVYLPQWVYLSGDVIVGDDASHLITLAADAQIVELEAEDGKAYYAINGLVAGTNSPGYVPADQGRIIGPLLRFTQIAVYVPTDTTLHYEIFRENA